MLRQRKILELLDTKKGYGTSLITVFIGYRDQLSQMRQKLCDEEGKAKNIKTKVTRKNAMDALVFTIEKLKLYNKTPKNGLVVFCGVTDTDEKVKLCF